MASILSNDDLNLLKEKSPYSLPDNPSDKGLSARQIKMKFYEGLLLIFKWLQEYQVEINTLFNLSTEDISRISQTLAEFRARFEADEAAYETIEDHDEDMDAIEARTTTLEGLFTDGKANFAIKDKDGIEIITYGKGIDISLQGTSTTWTMTVSLKDKSGNTIATKTQVFGSVSSVAAGLMSVLDKQKLEGLISGTYIAGKATADGNGAVIPSTYVKKSQIVDSLESTAADQPLSANQGKVLKDLIDSINALLASDDVTLDEIQEIVNYVKLNRDLITAITTSKVNVSDIIDALNSTATNKPLSANQGRVLKGLIDAIHTTLLPTVNSAYDLGSSSYLYRDLYLAGKIKDGTREMTIEQVMEVSNALGTIDAVLDAINGEVI